MCDTGRETSQTTPVESSLKRLCLRAVRAHYDAVGREAVLDLPAPLIKDLLPLLTVCQLDELQPALNQRGISTFSEWIGVLQDVFGPNHVSLLQTEEEAKQEVMRNLFTLVFYGISNNFVTRNIPNLHTLSFLMAAAKSMKHLFLTLPVDSLVHERRPVLSLLEENIRTITVSQCIDPSKKKTQTALYVLHRLLDHGGADKLVVQGRFPIMLAWILQGRGSEGVTPDLRELLLEDGGYRVRPSKLSRLHCVSVEEEEASDFPVDPQVLCQTYSPCGGPSAGACPQGQIHSLEMGRCHPDTLRVLISALPTFFCLRSLTLHCIGMVMDSVVVNLVGALNQLSQSSRSSLTDLTLGSLPSTSSVQVLLDVCPNLTSLYVEIQVGMEEPLFLQNYLRTTESGELPLEKLVVKIAAFHTDLQHITSVLRRCPRLTSLHLSGLFLPTGSSHRLLLTTISESNPLLRSLHLEHMQLSDCLPDIVNLLRNCRLEDLKLHDCRLLEKWSNKEESLQQLVAGLKTLPFLHTLSLAHNRLAKNVCVLAELFSGSSPSSVRQLNLGLNFIQAADLMKFAERLRTHRPPHRLTLDLRKNPGDRDPDTWNAALATLRPFCTLLVRGWTSTSTMADHISIM